MKIISGGSKIINRPRLIVMKVDQFEQLQQRDEKGVHWTVEDMKRELHIYKSSTWIREVLLKKHREEIEVKNGQGWCVFGEGRGHVYRINPSGARKWIEENFNKIDWDEPINGDEI